MEKEKITLVLLKSLGDKFYYHETLKKLKIKNARNLSF